MNSWMMELHLHRLNITRHKAGHSHLFFSLHILQHICILRYLSGDMYIDLSKPLGYRHRVSRNRSMHHHQLRSIIRDFASSSSSTRNQEHPSNPSTRRSISGPPHFASSPAPRAYIILPFFRSGARPYPLRPRSQRYAISQPPPKNAKHKARRRRGAGRIHTPNIHCLSIKIHLI